MSEINKIKELVSQLNIYRDEYYNNSNSVISDFEYDNLFDELRALEIETGFIMANSPTQTVGYEVLSSLRKVKHNHPMLSLAKTKDWNEFLRYFGNKSVIGMLKMDGLTCSLKYINGELVSAETRGNGEIGEDIFHNIKTVKSVPSKIQYKDELIVDGEIICTYKDFEPFSTEYKNPRNFASGSIRLLDSNECAKRPLTFVAWNVIKGFDYENSFLTKLELIDKQGFLVVPWTSSFDWDAKEFLVEQAKELGYPIDGLVGRFDNIKYGESLGETSHHSNAAYAFKFYDDLYETTLRDVEWTIGKTSVLTPTAVFDPVEIDNTEVSRASLHNISIMKNLGLTKNCTIRVYKANQIIPQVDSADQDGDSPLEIPKYCPICGGETRVVKDNDSEVLVCTNNNCLGKLLGKLAFFASKKAMDIDGLSEATIEFLINKGWVKKYADLYHLDQYADHWTRCEGFGKKSVEKLLAAIEKSRNVDLAHFITALSISNIGSTASKTIANEFHTYETFRSACQLGCDWTYLPDFGDTMSKNLNQYLDSNWYEMDYLANEMHFIVEEKKTVNGNDLSGKSFCITGSLTHFINRDALVADIEAHGGKFVSSVSSKCNYLINNDSQSASSKNKKAQSLGIPIITEEDYLKMLEE